MQELFQWWGYQMKCPRCKKQLEKNHPWQECYDCIGTICPETQILKSQNDFKLQALHLWTLS